VAETDVILVKNEPLRYTLGVVYEPNTVDAHEDWAKEDTIRQAAWDFARKMQGRLPILKTAVEFVEALCAPQAARVRIDITDLLAEAETVRKGRLGDMHGQWDDSLGDIVETYLAPCDMMINGQAVKAGSWMLGVVWSPEYFEKILAGERVGFSLGGLAQRGYGGSNA
jgi:hypothetical protein